ncbi:MAG: DUF1467 family protein [Paracoccaceae bacterium]
MSITSAIVLYAVIWFMVLLVVLPLRVQTQGDLGKITEGTHASAPEDAQMGRKARLTTLVSLVIWAVICAVILSEIITVRDIDFFNRMGVDGGYGTGG